MKDLTFPRVMMVSDEPITKNNPGIKRVVWAYNDKFYYPYFCYDSDIQTIEQANSIPIGGGGRRGPRGAEMKYAQDFIEPQIIELTLEDIATKFNVDVNTIKIKK
ncbi:MAG: hypothetical protein M0R17_04420 [Candidatus Omnitrophica bacterium]|jgi:hypothetical protein|nr:hypothetical protein [Candidatus Omnitrophota bacterium]